MRAISVSGMSWPRWRRTSLRREVRVGRGDLARVGVDLRAFELAAGGFENQLGDARAGGGRDADVGAALEAMRGVGVHAVTARGAADGGRIEPGGFDEHVAGFFRDHGIEAAHDAGQRDRLDGVGDDEVVGMEDVVHAVERLQLFARPRAADDDLAAFQQVEIEAVGGVADLLQRVVAGVGDVVDGARAEQFQALRDFFRRRRDLRRRE